MRAHLFLASVIGVTGLAFAGAAAQNRTRTTAAQRQAEAADWAAYNRTLAGDRFSPLAEIDRSNVSKLQSICTYTLPEVSSLQTGPIVISGTMYFTTETRSYAIDAGTCTEKWQRERPVPTPSPLAVHRGFAYMDGRLFRGTSDAHVLALDAADGTIIWDREMDVQAAGVTMPMAPIAANGLVYVGNAGGDQVGVTGHVYALDAKDGRVVWRFDVVPASGPARATWPNAERVPMTGGAFWTSFALDTETNILYVPAGNPAPDFDAELRGGDNLYTNSIIALDAATGRMLAYKQLVKRDTHDWDVNSPPVLVRTRLGRPVVASANKDGLLSLLDRSRLSSRKGVPANDPTGPLQLIYQVPTTTRENVETPLSRERPVRFCPGILGGNEWNGAAFHPALNAFYVGAVDWCASVQLQRNPVTPRAGQIWFGADTPNGQIQTAPETAKGWLTSFDADSGVVRWKFAAPRPVLAGVTPTAGGLVFSADLGGQLRAFDAESGRVLWQTDLAQAIGGGIVTYRAGGRQLVAAAAGMKSPIWPGTADKSRIVVFGLR